MNTGVLIFARLDSKRLPRKAVLEVQGRSLLSIVISRAKNISDARVIIASSDRDSDACLQEIARDHHVEFYGGNPTDLVSRSLAVISHYALDRFVRVNADSPLLSHELINRGLALMHPGRDFVTNLYPRSFPYGVSVEIVSAEVYRRLSVEARPEQLEHVTAHLYDNIAQLDYVNMSSQLTDAAQLIMTIDTVQDFLRYKQIIEQNNCDPVTITFEQYLLLLQGAAL